MSFFEIPNADGINMEIDVFTPEEELPDVDLIIVTAIYFYAEIERTKNPVPVPTTNAAKTPVLFDNFAIPKISSLNYRKCDLKYLIIKNFLNDGKNIYIWGAGKTGNRYLALLLKAGIEIIGVIENRKMFIRIHFKLIFFL